MLMPRNAGGEKCSCAPRRMQEPLARRAQALRASPTRTLTTRATQTDTTRRSDTWSSWTGFNIPQKARPATPPAGRKTSEVPVKAHPALLPRGAPFFLAASRPLQDFLRLRGVSSFGAGLYPNLSQECHFPAMLWLEARNIRNAPTMLDIHARLAKRVVDRFAGRTRCVQPNGVSSKFWRLGWRRRRCRTHGADGQAAHVVRACGNRERTQASAGLSFAVAYTSGVTQCRISRSRCGPIRCRIGAVASTGYEANSDERLCGASSNDAC